MYIVAYGTPQTGDFHIICTTYSGEEAMNRLPWAANIFHCEHGRVHLITA